MSMERPAEFPVAFLLFDQAGTRHATVEKVLRYYGKLRDFNGSVPAWGVQVVIANLVASAVNITLIGKDHPNFVAGGPAGINWVNASDPRVLPETRVFDSEERTLEFVWNKMYELRSQNGNAPLPTVELKDSLAYNFAYCLVPKMKWDSTWDFSYLTDPFGYWTWLVLFLVLGAVAIVAFWKAESGDYETGCFATFAVLLQTGSGNHGKDSKLFILWMSSTLVLSTFYTGEMTSDVITPPSEETLNTVGDLERNNFTLIFDQKYVFDIISDTVRTMSGKPFVQKNVLTMGRLLDRAVLRPDFQWYVSQLENGDKTAVTTGWPHVISQAAGANARISTKFAARKKSKLKGRGKKRKCYIGKELIGTGEKFFVFLPPKSNLLAQAYRKLFASGIVYRWYEENNAISVSRRVQERVLVKGRTTIVDPEGATVVQLAMEGKMVTVFLTCFLAILLSSVCFSAELLLAKGLRHFNKHVCCCTLCPFAMS